MEIKTPLQAAHLTCEDIIERINAEIPRSDVADRIVKIIRKEQLIIETKLAMAGE